MPVFFWQASSLSLTPAQTVPATESWGQRLTPRKNMALGAMKILAANNRVLFLSSYQLEQRDSLLSPFFSHRSVLLTFAVIKKC